MSQLQAPHPIVTRLMNLRKRVRMILAVHGGALLVASFLGALITLVILDYALNFGGHTRLLIGIAVIALLLGLMYRKLFQPLSTKLTDQFLAGRVELVNRNLADELISAVHFIERGTPQANALAAKAVEAAEARAKGVKFEDAVDFRPAMKVSLIAFVLAGIMVVTGIVNPGFASTAINRWFSPLGATKWPQVIKLEFLWGRKTAFQKPNVLPQGENFEIRVRVTGVNAKDRRVFLYQTFDNGSTTNKLMQCQTGESEDGKAVYSTQISPQDAREMNLRVECVDDAIEMNTRLARRPAVSALSLAHTPPDYVIDGVETVEDLLSKHNVRVVERSTLKLTVRSTNTIGVNGDNGLNEPNIHFIDLAREVEMDLPYKIEFLGSDRTAALVTMPATTTLNARVQIKDENGFDNLSGGAMHIDVIKDAMPTVSIEEPRTALRLVPNAVQPIKVIGLDDLGLPEAKWRVDAADQKPEDPVREEPKNWDTSTKDLSNNVVRTLNFKWELEKLNLKPGDRLLAFALARDNYKSADGKPHDWAKSPPLSVTILSPEALLQEKTEEILELRNRVEALARQQDEARSKVKAIKDIVDKTGKATQAQAGQLAELTAQQAAQASTAKSLSQRFEQVKQNMQTNRMEESDVAKAAELGAKVMEDVQTSNMNKAASELNKAANSAAKNAEAKGAEKQQGAQDTSKAAENATAEQTDAMDKMEKLAAELDSFNSVNQMLKQVNKAIEEQHKIGERISDAANSGAKGKAPEELTPEQKKKIDDIKADQNALQKKTNDLINQLDNLAEKTKPKDADKQNNQDNKAQSESLAAAAKAGKESKVTQNQGNAAEEAGNNQTSSASSSSSSAEAGLKKMKNELDKISQRQLEALSQELGDLIKILAKHKADETAIKDETEKVGEAADEPTLTKIGNDQGKLHQVTIGTHARAKAVREAAKAVPYINEALGHMKNASVALISTRQKESVKPENDAIEAIANAIKKLEEKKGETDDALQQKQLSFFIEKYTEIKKQQEAVKAGTDPIKADAKGKVDRTASIALAKMGAMQEKADEMLTELDAMSELAEYQAIRFMNTQILEYMKESRKRLFASQVGRELSWNQQRAIDGIADIIAALEEEKKKKDPFERPPSEGGGGGGGGAPPLIADSQQLKLLRAMQNSVNKDTVMMNKQLADSSDPAEKNAITENVQKLGATQEKIKTVANNIFEAFKRRQ